MGELKFKLSKKILKNYFAIILAIAVVLCSFGIDPSSVFANDISCASDEETPGEETNIVASGNCGVSGDNLTWTLDNNGLLTISGSGEMQSCYNVCPWDSYKDLIKTVSLEEGVTSIGTYAFLSCDSLTSVTIPNGVTSIGDNVFYRCKNLKSIEIPDSVTSIGDHLFDDNTVIFCSSTCWTATESAYSKYCITEKNISGKAGKNLKYSFDKESFTLQFSGSGVIYDDFDFIGTECCKCVDVSKWNYGKTYPCFKNYYCLESVTIPKGVTSIGDYSFYDCTNLKEVKIPNSVTSIGEQAFGYCGSLTDIEIPDSVTNIDSCAFFCCYNLASVKIPNGVKKISSQCFAGCSNLKNVSIPSSVTSIDYLAFQECGSLTNIEIPNSVTFINMKAFLSCTHLTSLKIPKNVSSFYVNDIEGCTLLKDVYIYGADTKVVDTTDNVSDVFDGHKIKFHGYSKVKKFVKSANVSYFTYSSLCKEGTHFYKTETTKATISKNGKIETYCSECGEVKSSKTIYYPKTITWSKTSFIYSGKAQKPTVTVKDSKGNTISSKNYTVTYSSGCKSVGTYTAKITFKGNYSGTVSKTFTIAPKGTVLTKLSASSKGFTATWRRQSTQTTGYQIQYSMNSKFTNAKTIKISENIFVSKKVTKLTGGKKYYVRVRTYKTVNGKNIYSDWSKAKTVTTKK